MTRQFRLKQVRSSIGLTRSQKETLRCLGLRKIGHEVKVLDTPANRGQVSKVQHLIELSLVQKGEDA